MLTPAAFRKIVLSHYKAKGRHDLPWRYTTNPYHILVSELMLQQTQVARVLPKYKAFLTKFPNIETLSKAPLESVLSLWVGLGYNRRAKYLKEAASAVVAKGGVFPQTEEALRLLPGVGPYTASALMAFAFDTTTVMIETNIRTVFLFHFYKNKKEKVSDKEILDLVAKTLPRAGFRSWYYALMDYGAFLKREQGSHNKQSLTYKKQSVFNGSNRQIRGAIIRVLTKSISPQGTKDFRRAVDTTNEKLEAQLTTLIKDGLIEKHGTEYKLAT